MIQILISKVSGELTTEESSKEEKRKATSSSKDVKEKVSSESHVAMDSRLLSALLTVSISKLILVSLNLFQSQWILIMNFLKHI